MTRHPFFFVLLLSLATAGCRPDCETVVDRPLSPGLGAGFVTSIEAGPFKLNRHTVDAGACGAAWVRVADVSGDGQAELVVSRYGKAGSPLQVPRGEVVVYSSEGDLAQWSRSPIATQADDLIFPSRATLSDLDGDGDLDALIPTGWFLCEVVPGLSSCGGILWYEQTPEGWLRHDVLPAEQELFFHSALLADLDGDGLDDLISVGERIETRKSPGFAEVRWWPGTLDGGPFEAEWHTIGQGLGTKPRLGDVDGDGDLDIYGAQYFLPGVSFGWFEQVRAPADASDPGEWAYHVIDDEVGGAIDMALIPDLLGDGDTYAVGSNHTNPDEVDDDPDAGVFVYHLPEDLSQAWERTRISGSIAARPGRGSLAPGIIGSGDLDKDGDIDLVVSGDGDERVLIYEQTGGGFREHVLEQSLGQAGGVTFADLDGDGDEELVMTGYEDDAIYIYETVP